MLIPLLSHSARRGRQWDASLEQANPLHKKSGRNFASDPYWRPRSLQRLQTTELLTPELNKSEVVQDHALTRLAWYALAVT